MNTIREQFYENDIRAETIIHLGTMCLSEGLSEPAHDAFCYDDEEVWRAIGLPRANEWVDGEYVFESGFIAEELAKHGKLGWLVKFAPVVHYDLSGGGISPSLAGYSEKWFYGETFEACCQQAITWRAEVQA